MTALVAALLVLQVVLQELGAVPQALVVQGLRQVAQEEEAERALYPVQRAPLLD